MFVNSPMRIHNILNACFNTTESFRNGFAVDTYNWQVYALLWNFDTRLLLGKNHTGKCIRRFGGIYANCRYFIDRKW